jgi:hypothetical protein
MEILCIRASPSLARDVQFSFMYLILRPPLCSTALSILLRFCVVYIVYDDCLSSKRLDLSAVLARFREKPCSLNLSSLELLAGSHRIQRCSQAWYKNMLRHVVITVKIQGYPHPTLNYQLQDDTSLFQEPPKGDLVGCCFLRDVDVCGSRIAELQESVLLRPVN